MKREERDGGREAKRFHTVQEIAKILRVNHKSIREGIRRSEIPHVRVGRTIRVPAAWVESLLSQGCAAPPDGT
jgi:excisionase family DNA binding protein